MGLKSKKVEGDVSANGDVNQHAEGARDADFSSLDSAGKSGPSSGSDSGEVAKLKAELADMRDKYLRALADFENLKKRAQKERSELLRYQGDAILVDILEVIDGFERALEHGGSDGNQLLEGIKMIHKQLLDALGKWEVRPDSAIGKDFDPNKHRAIAKAKGERAGVVVGELKKPYFYRDKLLRVGEVVVSDTESASEPESSAEEKA